MAKRAKRPGSPGTAGKQELPLVYEGPEVLSALLARAGSPHDAAEVAERFQRAQAGGQERSDVVPALFPDEPRFESADAARRLYGNLFALWDRLAAGFTAVDDAPALRSEPALGPSPGPPPLPPRGAAHGDQLASQLVEAVWKHLAALSERERTRLRDRFEGAQPDLTAWLQARPLPDEAAVAAEDLAFEAWAMFDVAFGERLGKVEFSELRALEAEPPTLEARQPALAAYVAEALDLVAEEEPVFGAAARAQVERALATVAAALCDALAPEDDA